jgi:hypothetical protein
MAAAPRVQLKDLRVGLTGLSDSVLEDERVVGLGMDVMCAANGSHSAEECRNNLNTAYRCRICLAIARFESCGVERR